MPLVLTKIKSSQNWYIRGTVARIGIFESARTRDRAKADALRIKREGETWDRAQLGIEKSEPVSFAAAALAYMNFTGVTEFMTPILDHFKETPIDQIGQAEIEVGAAAVYPKAKPATRIRQFYTPALAVLNHAQVRLDKIRKPKVVREPVEWNTDDYLNALLPHCNDRLRAIILLMTDTGLRVGEAVKLRRDAFTRAKGYAVTGKTKNGKPRMVPLSASAWAAIAKVMPETPFGPVFGYTHRTSVNTAIKRACRRARLPKTSPHRVGRHSFAARVLGAGHSLKVLQEAGGWESYGVVADIYGHLEQTHVHDAMRDVARKREKSAKSETKRAKTTAR